MTATTRTRPEIIKKAEELAVEYEKRYGGCAQTTFYAVADALRWGGFEILPPELQDKMYAGICLLSAGGCFTGEGTCGAVVGSILAGGFAFGLNSQSGPEESRNAGIAIRDSLMAKYQQRFGSILCKDVMRKYYGKAWDLTNDEATAEFLKFTDGCVIRPTAVWMTEILLDKLQQQEAAGV